VAGRSDAELDALVEQAIVGAYDEYEQLASFHVVIKEHLAVPCQTTVLGVDVTVTKIDLLSGSGLVAICSRAKHRQAIGILDLPLQEALLSALSGEHRNPASRFQATRITAAAMTRPGRMAT
jgi:hypothetical protein